ncbi:MAG: hypothetical protein AAF267_22185 [Deinococcota bacterium]
MDDHVDPVDNRHANAGNDGATQQVVAEEVATYETTLAYFVRLAQPGRGDGAMGRRLQGLFVLELVQATDSYDQAFTFRKPEIWLAFLVDVIVRYNVSLDQQLAEDLEFYYKSDFFEWEALWRQQFQRKLASSLRELDAELTDLGLPRLAALTMQMVLHYLRTSKKSLIRQQLGSLVNDYPLENLPLAEIFTMLPRLEPLKKGRYEAIRKRFESLQQDIAKPWCEVVTAWAAELETPLQGHHTVACLPAGLAAFQRIHKVLTHHLGYNTEGYLFGVFYKLATDASQGRTWSAPAHYGGSLMHEFFDIYTGGKHELELVRWGLSAGYLDTVTWLDTELEKRKFPELGDPDKGSTWYEYIDQHANIIYTLGLAFATEVVRRLTDARPSQSDKSGKAGGGPSSNPKAKPAVVPVARRHTTDTETGAEGHV